MTDRELMQMALDAFERSNPILAHISWARYCDVMDALRERLAQLEKGAPSHPSFAFRECEDSQAKLEQPKQKPIAGLWRHKETGRTRVAMTEQVITVDDTWEFVGQLVLASKPNTGETK